MKIPPHPSAADLAKADEAKAMRLRAGVLAMLPPNTAFILMTAQVKQDGTDLVYLAPFFVSNLRPDLVKNFLQHSLDDKFMNNWQIKEHPDA